MFLGITVKVLMHISYKPNIKLYIYWWLGTQDCSLALESNLERASNYFIIKSSLYCLSEKVRKWGSR